MPYAPPVISFQDMAINSRQNVSEKGGADGGLQVFVTNVMSLFSPDNEIEARVFRWTIPMLETLNRNQQGNDRLIETACDLITSACYSMFQYTNQLTNGAAVFAAYNAIYV